MIVKNGVGKGSVFYGMHFYPGVASYTEADGSEFRVFLNENTIRNMNPSFTGRPVFVNHVDKVEEKVDELRKEADGWVTESFYNAADGKHWVKFIALTEAAEKAIARGWRLSNCYKPQTYGSKGMWNGFTYDKEVMSAEYEHLAIVPNPRYEESVIMTPEQFKAYNLEKETELKRLSNSKNEGDKTMSKFKWFKREKVENSIDLEAMSVELPKSKREVTIATLINEADEIEKSKDEVKVANSKDTVEVEGEKMSVGDLVEKYLNAKKKNEDDDEEDEGDDDSVENAEDDEDEEDRKAAIEKAKEDRKENARKKARDLKNASDKHDAKEAARLAKEDGKKLSNSRADLAVDKMRRGQSRYGSK